MPVLFEQAFDLSSDEITMSKYHSYLNTSKEILSRYTGEEPFSSSLKKFFSLHKKYGSKDRKQISHVCYCYFRLGKVGIDLPFEERALTALFLCVNKENEIIQQLKPEWQDKLSLPLYEKISFVGWKDMKDIFTVAGELSNGIEREPFVLSHLRQPHLFLRLRPKRGEKVKEKLENAGLEYTIISADCLALPNGSKVDSAIELNKEAVVQDYSSQRTSELLSPMVNRSSLNVWDCCAASGGKSIMLYDLYPGIDLAVSDIRESILANLKKRFEEAGIKKYKSKVVDLVHSPFTIDHSPFDLIIADIPCSGSGTWGRAPENLVYFENSKIDEYASLQKKIVSNVIPHLKAGGYFLYITCSVFKKENEDAIDFIQQHSGLRLVKMEVLRGYDKNADTMFAALLQLPE